MMLFYIEQLDNGDETFWNFILMESSERYEAGGG